jgi:hypothetical protein
VEAGGERGCGVHGSMDLSSSINGSGGYRHSTSRRFLAAIF